MLPKQAYFTRFTKNNFNICRNKMKTQMCWWSYLCFVLLEKPSLYWRKGNVRTEIRKTRRTTILLYLFFCSLNNKKIGKTTFFFCSLKSVILRTRGIRKTKTISFIKQVFSVCCFQEQKKVLEQQPNKP